jgi:ketosteroid isomerase-like protein
MTDLISIVRAYYAAIEQSGISGRLQEFYTNDVIQEEFPNQLLPKGATRNLNDLKEASLRGATVVSQQKLEIVSTFQSKSAVAVEARWTGTLAVPIGKLKAGDKMHARFAQFFEFRDWKICRQRNYDCFDPF